MYHVRKKMIALALTIAMIFQAVIPANADIASTLHNTPGQNQTILSRLQSMYGGNLTQEDVEKELKNMGLLDADGTLSVSQNIMVDGTPMTLEQVKALMKKPGTDLTKTVSVDGTKVTLENLNTMIQIEDELKRLKKTYLSDAVPFDAQREQSYASLQAQLQSTGLNLKALSAESALNQNIRIKVIWDGANLSAQLADQNGNPVYTPLSYDVSFTYRCLAGSLRSAGGTPQTMTISAGQTKCNSVHIVYNDTETHCNGDQTWFLQVYSPVHSLFYQDADHPDSYAETFKITSKYNYSWTMQSDKYTLTYASSPTCIGTKSEPAVSINSVVANTAQLKNSALEIFGDLSKAWFTLETTQTLNSSDTLTSTVMTAKPLLKTKVNGVETKIDNAQYQDTDNSFQDYDNLPPQKYPVGVYSSTPGQSFTLTARVPGAIPDLLVFTPPSGQTSVTYSNNLGDNIPGSTSQTTQFFIYDKQPPAVAGVTAPDGTYTSGMQIPITVEFSEPVTGSPTLKMKDGTVLSPQEGSGTTCKYRSYLYPVPASPNAELQLRGVYSITDLSGNTTAACEPTGGFSIDNVSMKQNRLLAFQSLSVANAPSGGVFPYDGTIQIRLTPDTAYSKWMDDEAGLNNKTLKSVCVMANGKAYPLSTADEGKTYTAEIDAKNYLSQSQTSLSIALYDGTAYSGGVFSGGTAVFGMQAEANIASIVPVTEISITEPSDHVIYTTGSEAVQLKAAVSPDNTTFPAVAWSSSDSSIADIDANTGVVTPHKAGKVTFTATAHNNGVAAAVSQQSSEYTISNDGIPAVVFPKGSNAFYTRKNESVKLFWEQNLIDRKGAASQPVFHVGVYQGQFSDPGELKGTPVYSKDITNQSECTVPENILSKVSSADADKNLTPAYTVLVSAANPDKPAETLKAIGSILVYPQPVKAVFNKLASYNITDDKKSLAIGWNITNLEDSGDISLSIQKNGKSVDASAGIKSAKGSYSLNIQPVADGQLKDVYTVLLQAKSPTDSSWSMDSFVLNVYKHDSMKLMLDGNAAEDGSSVTMDNEPDIKSIYQKDGSQGILALNRNIGLKKTLSINFNQFPWGNVTDRILWKSADSKTASVNFRQGSLYQNVEKFDYISYSPKEQFMLVGNADGTTRITATHAPTGMKRTLNVTVKTLKDKLYLLNCYPKQETTVSYVNGKGVSRTLKTDSDGRIAIYEPDGIKGNVSLKSVSAQDTYLGTLFHDDLLSAEGDAGAYDPYPVNIFQLRPVTTLDLYLKGDDGNPYSGTVTYGGAVYRNNRECTSTEVKNQSMAVGSDGHFQLHFDSTAFSTGSGSQPLTGADKISFIYEIRFANDDYYPQLVTVDGSVSPEETVKFGDSVISLKRVPSDSEKNKPFLVSQKIDYHLQSGRLLDVSDYTGSIGPGNQYPNADLISTAAWWGESDPADPKDYGMKIEDEYGAEIAEQKSETLNYPFASMAYTRNVTTMTPITLNLAAGQSKGAAAALYRPDGSLYSRSQSPFSFSNMVGAPDADDKDSGINTAFSDMKKSGDMSMDLNSITGNAMGQMSGSDKTLGKVMQFMNGASVGSDTMNLLITATQDPMVYRGLITVSSGIGEDTSIEIGGADEEMELPGVSDALTSKEDKEDMKKQLTGEKERAVKGGFEYGLSITGYFEVEARYDADAGKWKMTVTGGGVDLGAMAGYSKVYNASIEGIPVTAEFGLGAQINLAYRAVKPSDTVPAGVKASQINDIFSLLQINLYVKAFGGFGWDYEIMALKIGIFGQIDFGLNNETLLRGYKTDDRELSDISASLYGTAGIKFVAKFLFVSYSTVLASFRYGGTLFTKDLKGSGAHNKISDWKSDQTIPMPDDPEEGFSYGFLGGRFGGSVSASAPSGMRGLLKSSSGLETVSHSVSLESRDYLGNYVRNWGGGNLLRASVSNAPSKIQTNAYPYANPVTTRDGALLGYLTDGGSTDVNKTRASWALKSGSSYTDQGVLRDDDTAGPDSSLTLDGNASFAVAAWTRQQTKVSEKPGETLSQSDVSSMTNSTKVMASVYNGSDWSTAALTDSNGDNLTADMAPVAAANSGRAIVAWRSVSGSSMDPNALDYSGVSDRILYKTYSGGHWSDARVLYNGSAGGVKGLQAAMLDDGTAGLTYTVDCGGNAADTAGWETFCSVVDSNGSFKNSIRLTNDGNTDENPQIAAVDFGTGGKKDQKFVLGWHTSITGKEADGGETTSSDILLAAVDGDGTPYQDFPDSLSSIGDSTRISSAGSFRFAKGENLKLDDLSLVWVEPAVSEAQNNGGLDAQGSNKDSLKAVKFCRDGSGSVYLSGTLDLAEMQDDTVIDHFDAAYNPSSKQIHTVMLATSYTGATEQVYTTDGRQVDTKAAVCSMQQAGSSYVNAIDLQDVRVNYSELKCGFTTNIPFVIQNTGAFPVNSVAITVDGKAQTFDHLNLLPNQKQALSFVYDVPDKNTGIHDVDYTVTAEFGDSTSSSKTGTLKLNLPDTGISKVELVGDEQGKRVIQATLQNLSDVPVVSGGGRRVYVAFYTSPDCSENDENGNPNGTLVEKREITGDDLNLLNQSALTMRFTYDVPADGIPSGGLRLYGRVWVEEKQADGSYGELVENDTSNNTKNILIANPVEANNGSAFRVTVRQDNSGSATVANLTVKNLSMTPSSNGNVAAQLLDEHGNVMETRLLAVTDSELLNLDGEESVQAQIKFSKSGQKVAAAYFTAGDASGGIANITAQGVNLPFDKNQHTYSLSTFNLSSTSIMAAAANPETYVTITDAAGQTVLAQGTGAVSYTLPLDGRSAKTVKIYSSAGAPAKTADSSSGSASSAPSEKTPSSSASAVSSDASSRPGAGSSQAALKTSETVLAAAPPANQPDAAPVKDSGAGLLPTDGYMLTFSSGGILKSIISPKDITGLANGTAKTAQALRLPETVRINTYSGTQSVPVTWDVQGCKYDPAEKSGQTFSVDGTVALPAAVKNPHSVSLGVSVQVTVKAKRGGSGTPSGDDGGHRGKETTPVNQTGPNYTVNASGDMNLNDSYVFQVTSTDDSVPSFVLGTPGVFSVRLLSVSGNEYSYRVTPIGNPGSQTGVYINGGGNLLILTVGPDVYGGASCDTHGVFDVQEGKQYQFKIVSDRKPVLVPGSSNFQCVRIRQIGGDWYISFVAAGKTGEGCGFYLNGSSAPVAIANIR
ncbi:Ig-like domain-containing protein [Caproicibacter sp.]|uniref:Ig-like domain-containing protein n=1 Tax=Caproicibacter sp. TaxID=2814884 RepID=UPI00398A4984